MFHLTYLGKELPFKVDYYVLKRVGAKQNKTKLTDFANIDMDDAATLEALCFHALERGAKKDSKPFLMPYMSEAIAEDGNPYTTVQERPMVFEDMEEILSECLEQFMMIVSESYPKNDQAEVVKVDPDQEKKS